MNNPKRTWKDIKQVRIYADKLESGWVGEIEYKDYIGKSVTFSVDYGNRSEDMLALTIEAIRRQMDSSKS